MTGHVQDHRVINVLLKFAKKLLICYGIYMAIVISLPFIKLDSIKNFHGLPLVDQVIYWKTKIDNDLQRILTKRKQLPINLILDVFMLIISKCTFMFVSSLKSIMTCIIIHHYTSHVYESIYMYLPDWLTDLHEDKDDDDRNDIPELELDKGLVNVTNTNTNTDTDTDIHDGSFQYQNLVNSNKSGKSSKNNKNSKNSKNSTGSKNINNGKNGKKWGKSKFKKKKSVSVDDDDDDDDDDGSTKTTSRSVRFGKNDSDISLNDDPSHDPKWYVFDPQFGVVTNEDRERKRALPDGIEKILSISIVAGHHKDDIAAVLSEKMELVKKLEEKTKNELKQKNSGKHKIPPVRFTT